MKSDPIKWNILFFLLFLSGVFYFLHKTSIPYIERFENTNQAKQDTTPDVGFPFKNIYDDQDRKIPIICLGAPFRSDEHKKQYEEYKKLGNVFLGSSSYQEFPGEIKNPFEDTYHKKNKDNYEAMTSAWIHCFREPENYFKTNVPKILLSESDFIDPEKLKPNPDVETKYDFIYVCLDEGMKHEATDCRPGWQSHNRNWELAKECLKILCGDFKLKGLIMGRTNCDITEKCNSYISSMPFQPQIKFFQLLQECKWIFVPNISDASPRVVTQAMCCNMPIVMNRNIVGGWKYVDEEKTGVYFTDTNDLSNSLYRFLNNFHSYQPREWYTARYGKEKAGRRLLSFLKEHYRNVDFKDAKYVTFKRL